MSNLEEMKVLEKEMRHLEEKINQLDRQHNWTADSSLIDIILSERLAIEEQQKVIRKKMMHLINQEKNKPKSNKDKNIEGNISNSISNLLKQDETLTNKIKSLIKKVRNKPNKKSEYKNETTEIKGQRYNKEELNHEIFQLLRED